MSLIKVEESPIKTEDFFECDISKNIKKEIEVDQTKYIKEDELNIKLEPVLENDRYSDVLDIRNDNKQIFSCVYCSELFEHVELYELHTVIHNKTSEIQNCPCCKKRYKSLEKYTLHIQQHLDKYKHCSICNKIFFNQFRLNQHITEHKKNGDLMCTFCGKIFQNQKLLTIHIRVHTNERPYECNMCNSKFKQLSSLKSHKELVHSEGTPQECEICNGKFCTKSSLRRHMKMHINGRTIVCKPCKMDFLNKELYNQHKMESHKKLSEFFEMCPHCNEEFFTYREYFCHLKVHLSNENVTEKKILRYNYNAVRKYRTLQLNERIETCWLCGEEISLNMFIEHKNKHMMMTAEELLECAVSKKFQCKLCDNTFSSKKNLLVHMDVHMDKVHKCSKGGCSTSSLFSYFGLSRHMRRFHGETRKSRNIRKCILCGLDVFKNMFIEHKNKHMMMTEEELLECAVSKKFQCKLCGNTFSSKKHLLVHMDVHMDKVHKCSKGGCSTSSLFSYFGLSRHMSRFHGESRKSRNVRKCILCGVDVFKNMFIEHKNKHMMMTAEELLECAVSKKFQCKLCENTLSSKKNLLVHMDVHMDKVHKCSKGGCSTSSLFSYFGLSRHMRRFHGESRKSRNIRKCILCGLDVFKNEYNIHINVHIQLSEEEILKCKISQEYPCKQCSITLPTKSFLIRHAVSHMPKTYACNKYLRCKNTLFNYVGLRAHQRTIHDEFICKRCNKTFRGLHQFRSHPHKSDYVSKKFRKEIFKCLWCSANFTNPVAIKNHYRTHKITDFRCRICDKRFPRAGDIKSHMNKVHKQKFSTEDCYRYLVNNVDFANSKEEATFICNWCKVSCNTKTALTKHEKIHTENRYQCKKCETCFTGLFQYVNHVKNNVCMRWVVEALIPEAKELNCLYCDQSFSEYFEVTKHIVDFHLGAIYQCKFCNSKRVVESLRNHLIKRHPRRKKYWCVGCNASFVTFKAYLQHRKLCIECPLLNRGHSRRQERRKQSNIEIGVHCNQEDVVDIPERVVVNVYGDVVVQENDDGSV